ncbi:MAG: WG repeat-containing protein [Clostridia bacterium]|nr:WG repeat-containing protein [Clostridia bacterium]
MKERVKKMDLFGDVEQKIKPKQKKQIKPTTILLIFIAVLVVITILIFCLLIYLKGNILKISINGVKSEELKEIIIIKEDKVVVPIKAIARYLGYEAYSGDYKTLEVDETKSYVKSEDEVTMFTAGSKIIQQILLENNSLQEIVIDEEIIEKDGEFYTTISGARKIFSIYFNYDKNKNDIIIMTLDYLYANNLNYYMQNGFAEINESFQNKKALLENMMILKTSNNKYGVINVATGKMILEPQYENIDYIPKLSKFIVTGNGLKGVISKDKEMVVKIEYKDIQVIENEKDNSSYYLVTTSNDLMGLIDKDGKEIIYPEYSQIGYNMKNFTDNDIESDYILFGKLVPVKQNNLWGIFDLQGNQITDFEFSNLGCTTKLSNAYNIIQVPEYELIIVSSTNGKYDIIRTDGTKLFGFVLDSVYKTINTGKSYYYMVVNGTTIDLVTYLEEHGITKVSQ